MSSRIVAASVAALGSFFLVCFPAAAQSTSIEDSVEVSLGAKIPMRDGIRLDAIVYRPAGVTARLPVIVSITPYLATALRDYAIPLAKNGYVVLSVDCRGRGDSEGTFIPFEYDAQDGYDVVEWAAKQRWSNGKVAMRGGSYLGVLQWATLKNNPPHLVTVVPMVSSPPPEGFARGGVFLPYAVRWLAYVAGRTRNEDLFNDQQYWQKCFRKYREERHPFMLLDAVCDQPSAIFQKWLSHPTYNEYWRSFAPTPAEYRRIDLPILEIQVYFDNNQLDYYRNHMKFASPRAARNHYLVIGPWQHNLMESSRSSRVGGRQLGGASVVDLTKLQTEWFDWTMKNGPKPAFLKKNVTYYAIGQEEWLHADQLDSIPTAPQRYFFDSNGAHPTNSFPGLMQTGGPVDSPADTYKYDPLSDSIETGSEVVYATPAFDSDTDIVGQLKVVTWISCDVPDTDFMVQVSEHDAAGRLVNPPVYQDIIRARYRESLSKQELVRPGETNRYEFANLGWRYHRIKKGNHLRVRIFSNHSQQRNYNSGGIVSKETAKDARVATVKFHHTKRHQSYLELPVRR